MNVLFLVVDSFRYDTTLGDWQINIPNIDRLAREGVTFSNCISQGISTAPAMTSMLTGRYPLDYGGHWYIDDDQPTMAEQFERNGYTTGAIHSNPNVSRLRNFDKGFDAFEENILPLSNDGLFDLLPDNALRYLNKAARVLSRTPYLPADEVNTQIADWLNDVDEPWFLWTQYMDTHGPYLPGDDFSYRNKIRAERLWRKAAVESPEEITDAEHDELRRNYELEVEYLDTAIGRFLDRLERDGHLEDTIIVIVGDHGDEFAEHGLYGHKNLPYDELTHVPLIIRFPETVGIDQSKEIDSLVRCIDILPTMLDVADADLSEGMRERMEGESLLPVIQEGQEPSYDVVVTEKEMRSESALRLGFRTRRWKYLYDGKTDEHELYDLEADPEETNDVSDEHEDRMEEFQKLLRERLDTIEQTSSDVEDPDLDDAPGVEERLKALGYK